MSRPWRRAGLTARAAGAPPVRNLGKTTAPTLQQVFRNERLFGRLDSARFHPVVWIHGPPGAGKTTLAASYLIERQTDPLWYRLDEADADPATLFLYLSSAWKGREAGMSIACASCSAMRISSSSRPVR